MALDGGMWQCHACDPHREDRYPTIAMETSIEAKLILTLADERHRGAGGHQRHPPRLDDGEAAALRFCIGRDRVGTNGKNWLGPRKICRSMSAWRAWEPAGH